jgi:hypothetical protein
MRKASFLTFILAAVMLAGTAARVHATGSVPCEDNWTAGWRAEHPGCTAKVMEPGYVSYADGTLYRHHTAPYVKGDNSDIDCHQVASCTCYDATEYDFTCVWQIQIYDPVGLDWDYITHIEGDCHGANWRDTAGWPPNREYRAWCDTNDTPEDGPGGDDPMLPHCSAGQMMWPPEIESLQVPSPYPTCNEGTGLLTYKLDWEPNCCWDDSHLDKVTFRERVTYEPAWSHEHDGLPRHHHFSHTISQNPPQNVLTGTAPDPTYGGNENKGLPASQGWCYDFHSLLGIIDSCPPYCWSSYCHASQVYQWATGWPNRPDGDDPNAEWHTEGTLWTYNIQRFVEDEGGWQYRIDKSGGQYPGQCVMRLQ